eukprot:sb/3467908/
MYSITYYLPPAGHFNIAGPGSLWKKQEKEEDYNVEVRVLKELNESSIRSYVPDYLGCKEYEGIKWIGMEDLMCHFQDGCGMDIKMGTRTFKESEVKNQNLRDDLYNKMVKQDPNEPTPAEREAGAITKLRYMTFREKESSSETLGFRIEAFRVKNVLKCYFNPLSKAGIGGFIAELENVKGLLEESTFFKEHEFIGTSLLFIYDKERVGVWMIDFGKTTAISHLVEGGQVTHTKKWELGNYEDGYLFGLQNLIQILKEIFDEREEDEENVHQHTTLRVN